MSYGGTDESTRLRAHLAQIRIESPEVTEVFVSPAVAKLLTTYPEGEWGIYCPSGCGLIFETQADLLEHLEQVPAHAGVDS